MANSRLWVSTAVKSPIEYIMRHHCHGQSFHQSNSPSIPTEAKSARCCGPIALHRCVHFRLMQKDFQTWAQLQQAPGQRRHVGHSAQSVTKRRTLHWTESCLSQLRSCHLGRQSHCRSSAIWSVAEALPPGELQPAAARGRRAAAGAGRGGGRSTGAGVWRAVGAQRLPGCCLERAPRRLMRGSSVGRWRVSAA